MKLEVGMYVRTKLGISKLIGIKKYKDLKIYIFDKLDEDLWSDDIADEVWECELKKVIVKASYNIIDILEIGDYANGYYVSKIWEKDEITHYVNETPIKRKEREIVIQAPSYGGIEILKNKNIKSVITHEQMEQMAYKVEE